MGVVCYSVVLQTGKTYTTQIEGRECDLSGNCIHEDTVWKFTVSKDPKPGVWRYQYSYGIQAA